tara:strand:- start:95 stop:325 length:231 start_codon:yes stop_codon:yes gene_type:complete
MFESIICERGLTIFWGEHLEHRTVLPMYIDTTDDEDSIEVIMLDRFINTLGAFGYTFLVLVDGIPFDWNFSYKGGR